VWFFRRGGGAEGYFCWEQLLALLRFSNEECRSRSESVTDVSFYPPSQRTRETDFQKDSFLELYIHSPGKSVYEATISNKRDCLE
jgi:hypothetical protein